ncbi:DUF6591 domain-containing protein [Bifidobacterium stellenboschense]|uniref:Permease n=1 Tax=Bifidobacterium stellenboschense TaxID=762211 RepID=A0A087DG87_9BIFI|nr:DUF6591 domain-containing protein [Bifidobacterium stellenboschense]KFI94537.1 permease [Bifidobacterium stellenboschense]
MFQAAHDQLSTGATFTLDSEDARTGTITFHDYEDARFTLTLTPTPEGGTEARLVTEGDGNGKRAGEFYTALDAAASALPAPSPVSAATDASGAAGTGAPATPVIPAKGTAHAGPAKKTSKLAVSGIVIGALFLMGAFTTLKEWSDVVAFAVFNGLLSGFAVYATRKGGKVQGRLLAWVAVGLTVAAFVVGGVHVLIAAGQEKADHAALEQSFKESQKVTCKDFAWPTTGLATQLPKPASASGEVNNESSSSFSVSVCDTDASQYASYVTSVQEKGFTVDYSKTDTAFNGKNEAGYSVHVSVNEYNKNVMDIAIYPPDDATDDSATTDSGSTDGTDGSTGTDSGADTSGQSSTQSGASDDFKTAMDSYEQTMNGYVDFMNKYNAAGQPASMLVDYTKWLKQYTDTAQKLDAIDESTLSPEDQQYFIEVQTRINQKLATVQ